MSIKGVTLMVGVRLRLVSWNGRLNKILLNWQLVYLTVCTTTTDCVSRVTSCRL